MCSHGIPSYRDRSWWVLALWRNLWLCMRMREIYGKIIWLLQCTAAAPRCPCRVLCARLDHEQQDLYGSRIHSVVGVVTAVVVVVCLRRCLHFAHKQTVCALMHAFNVIECFNANLCAYLFAYISHWACIKCSCSLTGHWVNKMDEKYKFAYFMTLEMFTRPRINIMQIDWNWNGGYTTWFLLRFLWKRTSVNQSNENYICIS